MSTCWVCEILWLGSAALRWPGLLPLLGAVAISPSLRAHSSVNLYPQVFNGLLGLSRDFSAAELEDVLVASVGDEGLLPDIHMVCC